MKKNLWIISIVLWGMVQGSVYAGNGHEAGYQRAMDNDIEYIDDCGGNSDNFIEGCESYVDKNYGFEAGKEWANYNNIEHISSCKGGEEFVKGCESYIAQYTEDAERTNNRSTIILIVSGLLRAMFLGIRYYRDPKGGALIIICIYGFSIIVYVIALALGVN